MVHGIANIGQNNRQQTASNGQQCFSAFCLFPDANSLIIKHLPHPPTQLIDYQDFTRKSLVINSLRDGQSCDFLPQSSQRIFAKYAKKIIVFIVNQINHSSDKKIVLNQDFNKIIKMNRIVKNLANLENLMKIVVQDKINHSSDKIKK